VSKPEEMPLLQTYSPLEGLFCPGWDPSEVAFVKKQA
jgi:hypothetical protein